MKISIITVTFNSEKTLRYTIESVLNQNYDDIEYLIIDGGSTDSTLDIIKCYEPKFEGKLHYISEPDKGIYDAMNKGIRLAKGKWINFMNGGDTFADNCIVGDFLRFAGDNPAADVIYGDFNRMLPDGGVRKSEFPDVVDKVFFYNKSVNHQASFIRSRLFRRFGMYDETFRIAADMDKWLMFVNNGCLFRHWERYVANFYLDGISSTHKQLLAEELGRIHEKRYGRREEKTVLQKISSRRDFLLFDIFPLLEIDDKNAGQTTVCKLFGVLPVYRKVSKHGKVRHYLFGFIPFLKIRQK